MAQIRASKTHPLEINFTCLRISCSPLLIKEHRINFYSCELRRLPPKKVLVYTASIGFPKNPGAINGGFYQKDSKKTEESPSFVIAVDDIKEHMKKITEAGGKILNGPDDIPGVGVYASFQDTEGNRVSILQAYSQM